LKTFTSLILCISLVKELLQQEICNLFNKLKEQLEVIKDGQQERNLTGKSATRKLEQWKSPSGKKHRHPESDLYPKPRMFLSGSRYGG